MSSNGHSTALTNANTFPDLGPASISRDKVLWLQNESDDAFRERDPEIQASKYKLCAEVSANVYSGFHLHTLQLEKEEAKVFLKRKLTDFPAKRYQRILERVSNVELPVNLTPEEKHTELTHLVNDVTNALREVFQILWKSKKYDAAGLVLQKAVSAFGNLPIDAAIKTAVNHELGQCNAALLKRRSGGSSPGSQSSGMSNSSPQRATSTSSNPGNDSSTSAPTARRSSRSNEHVPSASTAAQGNIIPSLAVPAQPQSHHHHHHHHHHHGSLPEIHVDSTSSLGQARHLPTMAGSWPQAPEINDQQTPQASSMERTRSAPSGTGLLQPPQATQRNRRGSDSSLTPANPDFRPRGRSSDPRGSLVHPSSRRRSQIRSISSNRARLFSINEGSSAGGTRTDEWFSNFLELQTVPIFRRVRNRVEEYRRERHRRVRVAILDTGVDTSHPEISRKRDRIKECRSWVAGLPNEGDICGHGTFLTSLFLKVAPAADMYVARIFKNHEGETQEAMREALKYAMNPWDVDIIVMSFGFPRHDQDTERLLIQAEAKPVLMFAAACNDGFNVERPTFPASDHRVYCVCSTNALGVLSDRNPPVAGDKTFHVSTLGEDIEAACPLGCARIRTILSNSKATLARQARTSDYQELPWPLQLPLQ
jgi:hypothetical protein